MAKAKTVKKQKGNKFIAALPLIKPSKTFTRKKIILAAVLIAIVILIFKFKGLFVAATVNGQPITRLEVLKQLEKEGGKSVLDNLVINDLVLQEAAKEKVTASSTVIEAQITQISASLNGQDLNSALAAQGMTRKDLEAQVKLQILVQKMAGKDVTVTDKEVEDYFNQNIATYPKGTKLDNVKDQIKKDLTQQKTNESITTWIANLKSKAKINYFVSY